MKKRKKDGEKQFHSLKKLWRAYKIARGSKDMQNQIKFAKKIMAISNGLYKRKLIEKLPIFKELEECQVV